MPSTGQVSERVFFDAGVFIGALCELDDRYPEAYPLVEDARSGVIRACTEASVLSEVYAQLTWERTLSRLSPVEAARVVRLLVQPPSAIEVLNCGGDAARKTMELAAAHQLTARRVHDARHASTALVAGVRHVYTYDVGDWQLFEADGLKIAGPASVLRLLGRIV